LRETTKESNPRKTIISRERSEWDSYPVLVGFAESKSSTSIETTCYCYKR